MIRIAHVWSSDIGLAGSLPHLQPLLERGWQVYGICPPGPRVESIERAGVRWLSHPLERRVSAMSDARGLAALYRTCRRHKFHIVHTHNAKVGILARLAATAAKTPVVVHTHNGLIYAVDSPILFRYGAAALERLASAACQRAFVQSEDDMHALLATKGAPRDVLELVGNGVDMARFEPGRFDGPSRERLRSALGIGSDEILFFSAGRIVCEKGFNELFEALAIARQSDPRVRLAVAGPRDAERGLGIDETVLANAEGNGALILGERSDMDELYAACDVVVLASWREGLPRVLLEGAAMGKPLIASDARGCRNVVRPGWGLTVPLRDVRALADAILRMTRDSALRVEIGKHNYEAARREYDLRDVLRKIDRAYFELLARQGVRVAAARA